VMYVMPDSTASVDALESAQSHFPHSLQKICIRPNLSEKRSVFVSAQG
jgi:hypothetical protein